MRSTHVDTVGELMDVLEGYDDDVLVRVSDDGREFRPNPGERDGKIVL